MGYASIFHRLRAPALLLGLCLSGAIALESTHASSAGLTPAQCVADQVDGEVKALLEKEESAASTLEPAETESNASELLPKTPEQAQAELNSLQGKFKGYVETFKASPFAKGLAQKRQDVSEWWVSSSFGEAQRRLAKSRVGVATGKTVIGVKKGSSWFSQWNSLSSGPVHFTREPGSFWAVTGRAISEGTMHLVQLLNPLPFNIHWLKQPLDPIFERLFRNSHYEPTKAEWALLEKYKAVDDFKKRQEFMLKNSEAVKLKRTLVEAKKMSALLLVGLIVLEGELTAGNKVGLSDFTTETRWKLKPNQIQLFDEGLIPHLSIRVGDRVYSYGPKELSMTPLDVYLGQSDAGRKVSKLSLLNWAARSNRSIQAVTLNLPEGEINRLRADLEANANHLYRHKTLANDTATQAVRVLRKNTSVQIPSAIDASPGLVMAYLSLLKGEGSPLVEEFIHVKLSGSDSALTRYLFSVSQESKIFLSTVEWNWISRAWLDRKIPKDDLKKYDPADLEKFQVVGVQAKSVVREDAELALLRTEIQDQLAQDQIDSHRRIVLVRLVESTISVKLNEVDEQLDLPSSTHDQAVYLSALRDAYQQERARMLRALASQGVERFPFQKAKKMRTSP